MAVLRPRYLSKELSTPGCDVTPLDSEHEIIANTCSLLQSEPGIVLDLASFLAPMSALCWLDVYTILTIDRHRFSSKLFCWRPKRTW